MTTAARAISTLLRSYLWDNPAALDQNLLQSLSAEQWLEVHQLALRQGVCAIVLDAIMSAEVAIPRPIKMRFISSTDTIEHKYHDKVQVAQKLEKVYSDNGIKLMILKGIGLAQLYPIPQHRPCSDIDIWLFGEQNRGDKLLSEKYNVRINEAHHHHTVFYINGVMIENHYDFIEQHSRSSKGAIESTLKHLSVEGTHPTVDIEGTPFYIPAPDLNALFLTMHSGAHFAAENISIRHLMDWAMFLKRYSGDIDREQLLHSADKFGFRPFLECINSACISYLGMPEQLTVCTMSDRCTVERAVEDVLQYKSREIPSNFFAGWAFRIRRRFANLWKQKMVFNDNHITAFIRSFLTHIIHPNRWRKE
ncbi:MAG: nucleotidyltransferase family protein [Alistipes sp.]|nr:nucleotidyltransferase family protein [Alistipes sp.]